MKIFVISLPQAVVRRCSVQTQMDAAGLRFEFFEGLSGVDAWRQFRGYNSREYKIHTGRRARSGEAGCYASHLTLWQRCIELDQSIVIMEDHFKALANFPAALEELKATIASFGFIRLEAARPTDTIPVMKSGAFRLSYCRKYPQGATCYAISPNVAREFVACSKILCAPVDQFIEKFWEHGQPLYALEPAPVILNRETAVSGSLNWPVATQPAGLWVRRMARKTAWFIGRSRFNAQILKAAKPRGTHARSVGRPLSL